MRDPQLERCAWPNVPIRAVEPDEVSSLKCREMPALDGCGRVSQLVFGDDEPVNLVDERDVAGRQNRCAGVL